MSELSWANAQDTEGSISSGSGLMPPLGDKYKIQLIGPWGMWE